MQQEKLLGRNFNDVFQPTALGVRDSADSLFANGYAGSFTSDEVSGGGMFMKIRQETNGFTAEGFYFSSVSHELSDPALKDMLHIHDDADFFFWKDPAPNDPASKLCFSEQAEKITGYTVEEVNSMPGKLYSIVHKSDVMNVLKAINELKNNPEQKSLRHEYRLVTKSGEEIWVSENCHITRNNKGEIVMISGITSNINELKLRQFELLKSEEELKELNESKDRFINILSHDLRGPYTSILGFAEILLNEEDLPKHEKLEYLTYIYDASLSQLQFINYLLDWSRLRTGKLKPEMQRIPVINLVHNCVSSLTGNAIRKNIEILTDVPESLFIRADERLVTQALINLLNNAIKFSYENSQIEVSVGLFNQRQAEFVVKDHGMGMSASEQTSLFTMEKFVSKEGSKGEKGSGFGLTLVKEIIDKHGGEIWFYSELNSGSEFHFTIPVPANTIMLVTSAKQEEEIWREIVSQEFTEYELKCAENGFEAIDLLQESAPALIISDNEMPLMSSEQFLESINPLDSHFKTPVILVSNREEAFTGNMGEHGVRAFLKSPFDRTEFVEAVKSIIN
ncbi:MAG: ATP-binding protein [Ignavibacteriaceae bacterium]|nr:MAG: ATP-binding protein [Ignavibacteriaceae bacterium]